ncbi:MAG: AraC family transcriptional regulator [Opitutaceae bacterium]|jgi:AraC-like DNA-binding protein|nr:AraC family transcriptional regulator [Opitutaceae bacterium]
MPREPSLPLFNWSTLNLVLRWAYDGEVAPVYRHGHCDHSTCYVAWFVRRGWVRVSQGSRLWQARPGQWLITPRHRIEQTFPDDARLLSVNIVCQWPGGENLFAQTDGLVIEGAEFPELEKTGAALCRLIEKNVPGARNTLGMYAGSYRLFLKLQRAMLEWMDALIAATLAHGWSYSHAGNADARVIAAASRLDIAPLNQPLPWREIIRETGLTRVQIDRLFQQEYSQTLAAYWNQRRLRLTLRTLSVTGQPLKELSHRLGFSQPAHFTRWFRGQTGESPQAWRLRHVSR